MGHSKSERLSCDSVERIDICYVTYLPGCSVTVVLNYLARRQEQSGNCQGNSPRCSRKNFAGIYESDTPPADRMCRMRKQFLAMDGRKSDQPHSSLKNAPKDDLHQEIVILRMVDELAAKRFAQVQVAVTDNETTLNVFRTPLQSQVLGPKPDLTKDCKTIKSGSGPHRILPPCDVGGCGGVRYATAFILAYHT
ncbi:hypothetical protein TNCV_2858861 [Trichonephila clavipes]|nr:hypothetical protein TNCV_2858861 [Trichonephila clavipes]